MTCVCPLCGSQAHLPDVAVNLGENLIVVDNTPIRVQPKVAELAMVFLNTQPRHINAPFIMASLYGSNPPTEHQARKHIMNLREALKGTRLTVEGIPYLGWRFDLKANASATGSDSERGMALGHGSESIAAPRPEMARENSDQYVAQPLDGQCQRQS